MGSKGTRYTEEQIFRILKEAEGGADISEVCRKYGVSKQTVYRWRSTRRACPATIEYPDAIILDLMLPGIDGFKVC